MQALKNHHSSLFAKLGAAACGLLLSCAALAADAPQVSVKTTMGEIVLELNPEKAPITVANFLKYVKTGYYKGTVFNRVIEGFVIQAGGMDAQFHGKKTMKPIKNESNNGLSNTKYTVAMAREEDPDSAAAQFYINMNDNSGLDYPNMNGNGYTVFGKVVKGQEVADKISHVLVDDTHGLQNVPVEPVVIKSVTVLKPGQAVK